MRGTFASLLIVHRSFEEAAALGFILIILGAACLLVINRPAGGRRGGVFG